MARRRSGDGWRPVAAGIAALVVLSLAGGLQGQNYIQDDVRISGGDVYTFLDGGERVTVVVGSFQLSAGKTRLRGRDAVLWVRTRSESRGLRHDIEAFIEGDAQVEEAGGSTRDRYMLVEMHVQGRIRVARPPADRSLLDLPLYVRAKEERQKNRQALGATRPAVHEAPTLVIVTRPTRPPAGTPPGPETAPPGGAMARPPTPKPVEPVSFYADETTSRKTERGRVIVATGNVYLSQGDTRSSLFLELRSQAAVVFVEPAPEKESRGPLSPGLGSLPSPGGDANAERETIVGVYLTEDVVISRGERWLRAPEAYYDFTTDRAYIRDPVFRTRQEQRNIPVYVRAKEGRLLSSRESWFRDARVSTSDFFTPTYAVHADTAYLMDETHYDEEGVRTGPQEWLAKLTNTTFDVRGLPIFYWPYNEGEITQENLAVRKVAAGYDSQFGYGVQTEWYLFRLLGLVPPEGFTGSVIFDYYERGVMMGANLKYARESFSGYSSLYGFIDREREDDFGQERQDIAAPEWRGWLLARHKQLMRDWEVQLEMSYLCDKNFLEEFFPQEFFSGKEQETLLYAKKQRDNWAFTSLLQYRLNRFQTETDSYPELALFLLGEPLANNALDFYSENRAGFKRFRPGSDDANEGSRLTARADTRQEIDFPLHLGPVNLVHYATGRITAWGDAPAGGEYFRPYGQVGVQAGTNIWRQDQDAHSRLWDVDGLRHIVSPMVAGFLSTTGGVNPEDLFPMDPGIEQHIQRMSGWSAGVSQRLQTRRGVGDNQQTVDWMRLNVVGGFFCDLPNRNLMPGDGRFFLDRPEYSMPRNHVNAEYFWQVSDSTLFSADTNYDVDSGTLARYNFGLSVQRAPRLSYFVGFRAIPDYDSAVGTAGVNYQISDKYRVSIFEQYDFDFDNGRNYSTSVSVVRKIERWYAATTFVYSQTNNETAVYFTLWPEGIPELHLGTSRLNLLGSSSSN